jgi:prophage tail gpP-like protein
MRALSFGPLETVVVEGMPPLKSIQLTVSAEEAVRIGDGDFVIIGPGLPVVHGQETRVLASGDLMLTGYVRDVRTSYDADSRFLGCSLVSRTIDFVECSADHESGEILNKDLLAIANELDGTGVGIETDGTELEIEPRHKLRQGESAFASIERRARGRGLLIHDTPQGRIKIASKPAGQHAGMLKRGVNILPRASANFTEKGRFSHVKVRGQSTDGSEKQNLRAQAIATDDGIVRKRTLIIPHEGEVTTSRLRKRAAWQARRAAGNGTTAIIPVTGWRDDAGLLWTPNMLVQVDDDWLGLNGLMIIKSVTFEQGEMTTATLSLADPRALGGENPRGKSGKSYAAPAVNDGEYEDE